MRLILFLLLVMVAASVAAVVYFGWIAVAVIAVLLVIMGIAVKLAFKKLLPRLLMLPFRAKGAPLRGAKVSIGGVNFRGRRKEAYPDEADQPEAEDADEGPVYVYDIKATIIPNEAGGAFKLWEPGTLEAHALDARPADDPESGSKAIGNVERYTVFVDGQWVEPEGDKFQGAQTLNLTFHMNKPVRAIRLRYYLEDLGEFKLV